eukprot:360921-Chlamydomonas_euryale.AAC.4
MKHRGLPYASAVFRCITRLSVQLCGACVSGSVSIGVGVCGRMTTFAAPAIWLALHLSTILQGSEQLTVPPNQQNSGSVNHESFQQSANVNGLVLAKRRGFMDTGADQLMSSQHPIDSGQGNCRSSVSFTGHELPYVTAARLFKTLLCLLRSRACDLCYSAQFSTPQHKAIPSSNDRGQGHAELWPGQCWTAARSNEGYKGVLSGMECVQLSNREVVLAISRKVCWSG